MERYPKPGERLWYKPWRRWALVREPGSAISDREVSVNFDFDDPGSRAVVKLRDLIEPDYRVAYTVTPGQGATKMDEDELPDSALTYTETLERDINRAETLAAHLQADLTECRAERDSTRDKLREMARVIDGVIAHYHEYDLLDEEWLVETSRQLRALAGSPTGP